MFSFNYNIVYFTLFYVFRLAYNLVEIPAIEDNDIAITESVIRNTVNDLFATFKVRGSENRPKLKKFSVIHNFFVSITLKDCENLKKIVQLSRVSNIDNNTLHFIAQINEVFDESDDNKSNEATDDIYVNIYIQKFIKRLRYLKQIYKFNEYFSKHDINEKILEHLSKDRTTLADVNNATIENDTIDNNDDEVWTPVLQSGRRIYNGHHTHITHYPFVVSVLFFDKFHCAGSIIRADLVVTAASCLQLAWNNRFFRENPAFLSVQIGSDFYEAGGEVIPVQEIYFHHEYDPKTLSNNIALMRLSIHIVFSKLKRKVKRINFDQQAAPLPLETGGIIIVGWGAKDNTGNIYSPWENRLAYAELDSYPLEVCQEIYTKEFVTKKHFCAGFFTKRTGACQHDVGGPGIYRGYLIGVISFGPPICGTADAPTVFTKVGFYKDWINKIIDTPSPYIRPLTTLRVSTNTFRPVYTTKTTKAYQMKPIMFGPETGLRRESLRILEDDKLFKDFLSTMFKQNEINNENPAQKELLRYNIKTATMHKNNEIIEPNKTTSNVLHSGFILDVAKKLFNFMGITKTIQSSTDEPLIEVIDNQVNIDAKSNTKLETEINEYPKNNYSYSDEENTGDLKQTRQTKHSQWNKAKNKYSTESTYPLSVGIEYNDDDSEDMQPQFKASDKDFKLKDDDSSLLEIDDRNEKTLKQGTSKVNKVKKVKYRSSAKPTEKPDNSEYEDVINDKLVEKYDNTDNGFELDSLVKDILDYVKEKPIKPTKSKKDMLVKKTRSKYPAVTTPLLKESLHRYKYNKKLVANRKTTEIMTKYENRYASADEKVDDDLIYYNEMAINVDISKEKVSKHMRTTKDSKLNQIRTAATDDIILSPVKLEYEDVDNQKDKPKMRGTADDETGEAKLAGDRNNKYKVKRGNKEKKEAAKKKSHKNANESIIPQLQLDSLVKDILDYVEIEPRKHIIPKKVASGKKARKRVFTATTRLLKKVKHENKKVKTQNTYDHANEEIISDSALELDISEAKDETKSSTVKKSSLDEIEYEDNDSKVIESKVEVTEIPKKSKNKYAADENINDYSKLETNPRNPDFSKEKTLMTTGDKKLHREKLRSSKHLHKHKPKYTTISTDKTEYEDEDGGPAIKNDEVLKNVTNNNSNIDDDTNNDMNTEEDVSNDSKLDKDITELLDELDLQKMFESAENKMPLGGSKKKIIKGNTSDQSDSQTDGTVSGDGSSETSSGMRIN